ncbi:MAG: hypothetical protein GXP55_14610 [Deltaproteobacteria bacterium]|nr:hypothetical protein [Deltaproteobacteria bacterium]
MHSNRGILCALLCALTLISLGAAPLRAQDAQERASAAEAYDRGTSAYLAQNFAAAARWFETAHRLAPAASALIQAVRAHLRADHGLRAATLALRLHLLYPDDQAAQEAAAPVLEEAAQNYVRVEVSCDDCTLELDGTLLETPAFFVDPGGDHALIAHFPTGEREATLRGSAGDELSPAFEAPPASTDDGTGHGRGLGPAIDTPEPASGLPMGVFFTSLALTAGAGAALVWSGLDTNSDADTYEASIAAGDFATAERQLAKGRDEERRTNILIGITAGLGLTTALLAAFTKWGGDSSEGQDADEASGPSITGASLAPLPGGGAVGVQGRF